jgi:hypothetical protein
MTRDMKHFGSDAQVLARVALLMSAIDYLEMLQSLCTMSFAALPRLLMGHELPWPCLAMVRICAESAARFCYVIDPQIAPEDRLMRMAGLMLWSNSEESKMARSSKGTPDGLKEMIAAVDNTLKDIHRLVSDAGFEVRAIR